MASLVNALTSMARLDGSADIIRRRAELKSLISVLLPSEIRLLKEGIKDMTFIRDFVPELPTEIRIGITAFLDLPDLITVRSVSERWFESWTQVSICNKLMKEYFRSEFENTYMLLPESEKRCAFIAASERLHAMHNGKYHSMTFLSYDRDKDGDGEPAPILDRRYCNGRVAWSIEGGIKVSKLCTGEVSTYMLPNRDKVQFWKLSETVVVAGTADKAKLHAWPLQGGNITTIRLPSLPSEKLSTQGDRVGIVTSKNEVLIWEIGGSLVQMKITDPIPYHKGFRELAVLFHPDSIDIIFVIFLSCKKVDEDSEVTGTVQWRVQKYINGELATTYKLEYPLEGLDYRSGDEPAEVFWLSPRKIDDNGVYSIGPVPVDFASRLLDLGCHHHWDRWYGRRGHRHLAHHITFDIYEERLSTCFYHLPGGQKDVDYINFVTPQVGDRPLKEIAHLWSGQIFLPIIKLLDPVALRHPRYKLPVKTALLMAIKSCDQIEGPPTDVRYIGGYGLTSTVWNTDGRFATRDLGLMYCWIGDPDLAQQNPSPATNSNGAEEHHTDSEIRGDGTFVVLFGKYDYVVWCYDKNIRVHEEE